MKKKIFAAILIGVVLIGAVFTVSYTTDDPLITESYLNDVFFKKVKDYIAGNSSAGGSATYSLVSVKAGGSLAADAGCEFIIRQGNAKVVVSSLGGISDVTDGVDIISGYLPLNHQFVVPRTDGRGFIAETAVLVMVKGPYKVY